MNQRLPSPRLPRLPRLLWIFGGLVIVACISGIGIIALTMTMGGDIFGSDVSVSPAQMQQFTGITLPASASNIQIHTESFQDTIMHVRFDLPAAETSAWVAAQTWQTPPTTTPLEYPFTSDFEWMRDEAWWHPKTATRLQIGTNRYNHPTRGIVYRSIMLDTSDPATTIVYVVGFDT